MDASPKRGSNKAWVCAKNKKYSRGGAAGTGGAAGADGDNGLPSPV